MGQSISWYRGSPLYPSGDDPGEGFPTFYRGSLALAAVGPGRSAPNPGGGDEPPATHEGPLMSLLDRFASSTIRFGSELPLGVSYDRVDLDASGNPSAIQYWNHATGGWAAGPLDPAKHVKPLPRVAESGAESNTYTLAVNKAPMSHDGANMCVWKIDTAGVPTVLVQAISAGSVVVTGW